jgi:uncharacterized protein
VNFSRVILTGVYTRVISRRVSSASYVAFVGARSVAAGHLADVLSGPGRPRLGVVSREVSLLPRHWAWLEEQPNGISAALRRLVEQGIRTEPGTQRAQRMRAALSRILGAIAGDRPNFEEACRTLYAGDMARFEALVARWPHDIKAYATEHAAAAARAERETT